MHTPKEPKLHAHCARTAPKPRVQRRVVAHWALYLGVGASIPDRVVVRTGRVEGRVARYAARRVIAPRSRYKNCIATQSLLRALRIVSHALPRVSQRSCAISQGSTGLYHSLDVPYRDTKGHSPVTIQKLYRDPLRPGRPRALAPLARARRPVVSQPLAGRIAGFLGAMSSGLLRAPALPCVTIQSVVS